MKIKNVKNQNYKLFKYNLLKLQIYSNKFSVYNINFANSILEQIEIYIKQVLKIVFEYHLYQFRILFIGFPVISKIKQEKLMYLTNHDFVSEKSWISGIFRNRFSILTYLKLIQSQNFSKSLQLLLTIKTKPHLIVIFNPTMETSLINEFYKAGIPILSFNWEFLNSSKILYQVLGKFNFNKMNTKLTFFYLFYSLLKKPPLLKRKKYKHFTFNTFKKRFTKKKFVFKFK